MSLLIVICLREQLALGNVVFMRKSVKSDKSTVGEPDECTVYETVGGRAFFDELADRFYQEVEANELLRPLYPDDLAPPRVRFADFLSQYWGGPNDYNKKRGHPRLRMRHASYTISVYERNAWMECMTTALKAIKMPNSIRIIMIDYFENAATFLINSTHPSLDADSPANSRGSSSASGLSIGVS